MTGSTRKLVAILARRRPSFGAALIIMAVWWVVVMVRGSRPIPSPAPPSAVILESERAAAAFSGHDVPIHVMDEWADLDGSSTIRLVTEGGGFGRLCSMSWTRWGRATAWMLRCSICPVAV